MKILRIQLAYITTQASALKQRSISGWEHLQIIQSQSLPSCAGQASSAAAWGLAGSNSSVQLHSLQSHAQGAADVSFVLLLVRRGSKEGVSRNNGITTRLDFILIFYTEIIHSWVLIALPIPVENKKKNLNCDCQTFSGILLTSWCGWFPLEMSSG